MRVKYKNVDAEIIKDLNWLEFYRENPIIAAEDLLRLRGEPLRLAPHQRIILRDLWKGTPFCMLIMTRGGAKTSTVAIYFALRAVLYGYEKIGIISASFRQARRCFDEIVALYDSSPVLRACSEKVPTKSTDECRWEITDNHSIIKALPVGDGDKIRGERFFKLFIDEFPKLDKEIVDSSIRPMLATRPNPTKPMTPSDPKNQLIMAYNATWQFSWGYDEYLLYKQETAKGNPNYSLHEFDAIDLKGFLDPTQIENQRKTSPRVVFLMEYMNVWPSDSHGWFPQSLIEKTKDPNCLIEPRAKKKDAVYVLGVDPARTSDLFAMVVLRIDPNGNRVVKVRTRKAPEYPEMVQEIRQALRDFNIVRIAVDFGGGGLPIKDALAEGAIWRNEKGEEVEEDPILPIDVNEYPNKYGRRIVDLVYFSPKEIHQMNVNLKSAMEKGKLKMPSRPNLVTNEEVEEIYEEIGHLEDELRSIVTTLTKTGLIHFDTPSKRQSKDRYSALLLANKAAKDYLEETEETKVVQEPIVEGFWV